MNVDDNDFLLSIKHFIRLSTPAHNRKPVTVETGKCAVDLLRSLPSARTACLEHLGSVVNECVNAYILQVETDNQVSQHTSKLDEVLVDLKEVFSEFVRANAKSWNLIISKWVIEQLLFISRNYCNRKAVPPTATLSDLIHLWTHCGATLTLVDILKDCLGVMDERSNDSAISSLIESSVKCSPHFDWVLILIGTHLPNPVISKLLITGLKDYFRQKSNQPTPLSDVDKIPVLNSIIAMLCHLAGQFKDGLRNSMIALFKASLAPKATDQELCAIPYLLHLASSSQIFLDIVVTDLVDSVNDEVLGSLVSQFQTRRIPLMLDVNSFLGLSVHLLCRSSSGSYKVLNMLLKHGSCQGDSSSDQNIVARVCSQLVEVLLMDIQPNVHRLLCGRNISADGSNIIPFLDGVKKHKTELCEQYMNATDERMTWLERIISLLGLYEGETVASDILVHIFTHAETEQQLAQFINMQQRFEQYMVSLIHETVKKLVAMVTVTSSNAQSRVNFILNNFVRICRWEASDDAKDVIRCTISPVLRNYTNDLVSLITNEDRDVCDITINLFMYVSWPEHTRPVIALKLCQIIINYFITLLHVEDLEYVKRQVGKCNSLVDRLCTVQAHRIILIKYLMLSLTKECNRNLFSSSSSLSKSQISTDSHDNKCLLDQNYCKSAFHSVVSAKTAIFHAGVIGKGVRAAAFTASQHDKERMKFNTQTFLNILYRCASSEVVPPKPDEPQDCPQDTAIIIHTPIAMVMATTLIELVGIDTSYVGVIWPDVEYRQWTMERDLQVKRMFSEYPLLWDCLQMIADSRPALCHCSVIVYCLLGNILSYWETTRTDDPTLSPSQLLVSCRIITILTAAEFITAPLTLVGEILPMLTCYNIFTLLSAVWKFIKENLPHPEQFVAGEGGQAHRQYNFPRQYEGKYLVDTILQRNIEKFGNVYTKFFPENQHCNTVEMVDLTD